MVTSGQGAGTGHDADLGFVRTPGDGTSEYALPGVKAYRSEQEYERSNLVRMGEHGIAPAEVSPNPGPSPSPSPSPSPNPNPNPYPNPYPSP